MAEKNPPYVFIIKQIFRYLLNIPNNTDFV